MSDDQSGKRDDLLGIKGLSDSVHIVTKGTVDGVGALLGRICLPAAEELGLYFKDKVSAWRSENATAIAREAEKILLAAGAKSSVHAHPKIVGKIFELGSWEDDADVQRMWAGLLASACTEDGRDQRNLIFISLLSQMSPYQVQLLEVACKKSSKYISKEGLVYCVLYQVPLDEITRFLKNDLHDADVQLDHMRELGVIVSEGGFSVNDSLANITPSPLGLHLYVRCQGFERSPVEYFNITTILDKDEMFEVDDAEIISSLY